MKIEILSLLAFLAARIVAKSLPPGDLRSLCPADQGQKTGTITFYNGVEAEYTCRVKVSGNPESTEVMAATPQACATKCIENPDCSSALLQASQKRCMLYTSEVTFKPHSRGSLYLKPIRKPCQDCQDEKERCERELDAQKEWDEHLQRDIDEFRDLLREAEQENKDLKAKLKTCEHREL
ncbi:hypothetical protein N7478_009730 [Penicillium angulare]|uniref:uncharacterized protein n=1 Tax=Penicillium angulare TaxID=116970 RepID=UPI0025421DA1|nr:uncharacterized protein N7478_009730 [Penicillium angulare]KAJ5266922.1 hypothetical protein N7478_009730 [Penicillium angulare]